MMNNVYYADASVTVATEGFTDEATKYRMADIWSAEVKSYPLGDSIM